KSASGGAATHPPGAFMPPPTRGHPSTVVRALELSGAPAWLRPLLFALLAIAIGLLTVAAVPQSALPAGQLTAVIVRRRPPLALAGIGLLGVVALVLALT